MFNKELNRRVGRLEERTASIQTQVSDTNENVKYIRDRLDTKVEEPKEEKNGHVTWGKLFAFASLFILTVGTIFGILWNIYPDK